MKNEIDELFREGPLAFSDRIVALFDENEEDFLNAEGFEIDVNDRQVRRFARSG